MDLLVRHGIPVYINDLILAALYHAFHEDLLYISSFYPHSINPLASSQLKLKAQRRTPTLDGKRHAPSGTRDREARLRVRARVVLALAPLLCTTMSFFGQNSGANNSQNTGTTNSTPAAGSFFGQPPAAGAGASGGNLFGGGGSAFGGACIRAMSRVQSFTPML